MLSSWNKVIIIITIIIPSKNIYTKMLGRGPLTSKNMYTKMLGRGPLRLSLGEPDTSEKTKNKPLLWSLSFDWKTVKKILSSTFLFKIFVKKYTLFSHFCRFRNPIWAIWITSRLRKNTLSLRFPDAHAYLLKYHAPPPPPPPIPPLTRWPKCVNK